MEINNKILERLQEWQQKEGELPQYLELYKQLLLIQIEANVPSRKQSITKEQISATLRKGVPILTWDALFVDWPIFQKLLQRAAIAISDHAEAAPQSLKNLTFDIPQLREAARAWYEGSTLSPAQGVPEEILAAIIHCALKPFLAAQAEPLTKMIDYEQWRRRTCPVCGGKPDFAFLEKQQGARWLLCSRCDSEWLFQRLECPYCGNQNQNELAYFSDDKELYRLYVCQRCHSYLKAIDLRKTDSEILLPLERVLTADMDRQAQEKGFKGG